MFALRGKHLEQCHNARGILPVLARTAPPPVKFPVQCLAYGFAVIDQPRTCWPIVGGNVVFIANAVELLAGELWGVILHCCLLRVVRIETCDHIASIPFYPAVSKPFFSDSAGFQ